MRIGELADLTGTTVRTVRHYHAVGLLPVPEVRHGWRDYTMVHVARLSRIRWLAEAGLSLATICELLADRPTAPSPEGVRAGVVEDLRAALEAVAEQARQLEEQRRRLARLVDVARSGQVLTPMAADAVQFYERLEGAAPDERTRRAVREERDFVELAYYRGEIPAEAELLFAALDDESLQESIASFGRDRNRRLSSTEVAQLADGIVARMLSRLGPHAPALAGELDVEKVRRTYELFARTVDQDQARLAAAVFERVERVLLAGSRR